MMRPRHNKLWRAAAGERNGEGGGDWTAEGKCNTSILRFLIGTLSHLKIYEFLYFF
uniref:Uncharacterized protein n=1 Tax=Arundo donax TaxID=35708 RepID=A0A0A9BZQ5_ARUDO